MTEVYQSGWKGKLSRCMTNRILDVKLNMFRFLLLPTVLLDDPRHLLYVDRL